MENELENLKKRLESINNELHYFWEDHLYEKDPYQILVLWGRLTYMIGIKITTEWDIERKEEELSHGRE